MWNQLVPRRREAPRISQGWRRAQGQPPTTTQNLGRVCGAVLSRNKQTVPNHPRICVTIVLFLETWTGKAQRRRLINLEKTNDDAQRPARSSSHQSRDTQTQSSHKLKIEKSTRPNVNISRTLFLSFLKLFSRIPPSRTWLDFDGLGVGCPRKNRCDFLSRRGSKT